MWLLRKPYQHLLVSMIVIAAIPLVFSLIFWWGVSGIVNNQMNEIIRTSHVQNQVRIDNILYELARLTIRISNDSATRSLRNVDPTDLRSTDRIDIWDNRQGFIKYLNNGPEHIRDIYVYMNHYDVAITSSSMKSDEGIMAAYYRDFNVSRAEMDAIHKSNSRGELIAVGSEQESLVFIQSIRGQSRIGMPDMQIVIVLKSSLFDSSFMSSNELASDFFIFSEDGATILAGHNQSIHYNDFAHDFDSFGERSGEVEIDGMSYFAYRTESNMGNYIYCSLISNEYIKDQTQNFTRLSITIFIMCLLLASFAVIQLTKRNYIPIEQILKSIEEHYGSEQTDIKVEGIYAIQNTVQDLIIQKHNSEQSIAAYNRQIGVNYLKELLLGHLADDPDKNGHFPWIMDNDYVITCFYAPSLPPSEDSQGSLDMESYALLMETSFQTVLENTCYWEVTMINGMMVLVIGSKEQVDRDISTVQEQEQLNLLAEIDWFTDRIEQIAEYLDKRYNLPVQASISNVHSGIAELETAYHESILAMEYCFLNEDVAISRFDANDVRSDLIFLDSIHLNRLLQFSGIILSEEYDKAIFFLDGLIPDDQSKSSPSESELSSLQLAALKYQFLQVLEQMYEENIPMKYNRNESMRKVISCQAHLELKDLMMEQLVFAKQSTKTDAVVEEKDIIDEVKYFVDNNYDNNQLNVSSIAEHFNILPNTLSKQFSRKTSTSLLEYIHITRIDQAREVIVNEEDVPLYEVAERVGYSNALTFTRAFKTYNDGQTPGEFRTAAQAHTENDPNN